MRHAFAGMAVGVEMNRAVVMAVRVDMHAVAPQPPQQMRAEADQHDADRGLQRRGELFGDGVAEQDRSTRKRKQRQRMPEPPGQPVLDDVADVAAPRRDRGDGGDMIGLQRMLHAQQEAKTQDCEHASPALLEQTVAASTELHSGLKAQGENFGNDCGAWRLNFNQSRRET